MLKTLIILIVLAGGVYLVIAKPWQPKRYNDTPAGKEAKIIDEHVQSAFDWRPPDKVDAATFLGEKPSPKVLYEAMLGGMGFDEAHKLFAALKQAGAKEVVFINVKQSVREGAHPEALVSVLPDEPPKRAPIFTAAAVGFSAVGKTCPPDVKQKYLYIPLSGSWTPDTPKPGWLPGND